MRKIITAKDVALRDNLPSVQEWFRVVSLQQKLRGVLDVIFDGRVARGPVVLAFISNGRAQGMCPHCGGCEYVDPDEPVFGCLTCGNKGTGALWPVKFPADWDEICKALLEREMFEVVGGSAINRAFNARPADQFLRRDWAPKELVKDERLTGRVVPDRFGAKADEIRARTKGRKEARG